MQILRLGLKSIISSFDKYYRHSEVIGNYITLILSYIKEIRIDLIQKNRISSVRNVSLLQWSLPIVEPHNSRTAVER